MSRSKAIYLIDRRSYVSLVEGHMSHWSKVICLIGTRSYVSLFQDHMSHWSKVICLIGPRSTFKCLWLNVLRHTFWLKMELNDWLNLTDYLKCLPCDCKFTQKLTQVRDGNGQLFLMTRIHKSIVLTRSMICIYKPRMSFFRLIKFVIITLN